MRHPSVGNGRATRKIDHVLDVRGPHDALVVHADVHVELVQRHILLGVGSDQVVEL